MFVCNSCSCPLLFNTQPTLCVLPMYSTCVFSLLTILKNARRRGTLLHNRIRITFYFMLLMFFMFRFFFLELLSFFSNCNFFFHFLKMNQKLLRDLRFWSLCREESHLNLKFILANKKWKLPHTDTINNRAQTRSTMTAPMTASWPRLCVVALMMRKFRIRIFTKCFLELLFFTYIIHTSTIFSRFLNYIFRRCDDHFYWEG